MKRLESHVESIVGPLRASEGRKDRIREELLDHLELAREESRDRGLSDVTAAAIERFGSIDAVRAEIQDAVPAWERWLCSPVKVGAPLDALFEHDPKRDRTPLRFAVRRTVLLTSLLAALVAVTLAALAVLAPPPSGAVSKLDDVASILGALVASTFASFYVLEKTGVRAKLDLRDPCSAGAQIGYLLLFIALYGGSFLAAVHLAVLRGERDPSFFGWVASWSPSSAAALLGALGLGLLLAWKEASETKKRYARWGTTPRLPAE